MGSFFIVYQSRHIFQSRQLTYDSLSLRDSLFKSREQRKNVQPSQNSVHGNLLDILNFSSFENLLCKQTLKLLKHEVYYDVELSVTPNLRWNQILCEINSGGPLSPIFSF